MMKRLWPQGKDAQTIAPKAMIGRAHLDEAKAAGLVAGRDPDKAITDCPYDRQTRPMTAKAWDRGFSDGRVTDASTTGRSQAEP